MTTDTRQPKEMYLLALAEMSQRFAFWGIANLLVLYLVQAQKFTDSSADRLFGIFTGASFVLPVFGGFLADRIGYRLPVLWGIISTTIGCFLMATGILPLVFLALIFVGIGAGIFTPSIYALLGAVYHGRHHLRESGFSIYYSAVNIGAFLAMVILGAFGQAKHWNIAFFLAGLIQLVGIFPFRRALKTVDLTHVRTSVRKKEEKIPLHPHEKQRIWVIVILSFFSILFWLAYNQGGSSLNLFALRYTNRSFLGFEIPPSWLLSSETFYLILFAFPLAKLYGWLVRKKWDITPPMKSALSLFAIALCFMVMVKGSALIPPGATSAAISPSYLLIAYGFMALGEMLIAPIGLSLITHLSPHRLTALLVGVWYACIGIAFYSGGVIASFMSSVKELSSFFAIFVILSLLFGAIHLFLVRKLNRMRKLETL